MQRHLLGIIAVGLLMAGVGLWLTSPHSANLDFLRGACVRVGLVAGAFWLAWPHLQRIPAWLVQLGFGAAAIVAIRPRAAIVLIPLLLVIWIVRPRKKKSGSSEAPVRSSSRR